MLQLMKPSAERSSPSKFKDHAPDAITVPSTLPVESSESFQGHISPIVELANSFLLNSSNTEADTFAGYGYVPTTLSWADQVDLHDAGKSTLGVTFQVPTLHRDVDVTVLSKPDHDDDFVTTDGDDEFKASPSPSAMATPASCDFTWCW
jgi:hypothetical protein